MSSPSSTRRPNGDADLTGRSSRTALLISYPNFVSFSLGEGSSPLALYEWDAAAQDAGVSPDGPDRPGFRGVSFHFIVASGVTVDEIMRKAVAAGGSIVKDAADAPWGGYFGYFSDPDGHLWKVASPSS